MTTDKDEAAGSRPARPTTSLLSWEKRLVVVLAGADVYASGVADGMHSGLRTHPCGCVVASPFRSAAGSAFLGRAAARNLAAAAQHPSNHRNGDQPSRLRRLNAIASGDEPASGVVEARLRRSATRP
jgi:hypothetical protein